MTGLGWCPECFYEVFSVSGGSNVYKDGHPFECRFGPCGHVNVGPLLREKPIRWRAS